jgi:hypothetical protein
VGCDYGARLRTALFMEPHALAMDLIMAQIGRCRDSDQSTPARNISSLRSHELRHTFAFELAHTICADAYLLDRCLDHRS